MVDVIDEVATDLSQFFSSTDGVGSSGMEITTYHYVNNLNWQLTLMLKCVAIFLKMRGWYVRMWP